MTIKEFVSEKDTALCVSCEKDGYAITVAKQSNRLFGEICPW